MSCRNVDVSVIKNRILPASLWLVNLFLLLGQYEIQNLLQTQIVMLVSFILFLYCIETRKLG